MTSPLLRIQVLGEPGAGTELPTSGTLVVGSNPDRAQIVVAGQGVDEAHFAIGRTRGGGWAIKDLGSRYGTIHNGERVTAAKLAAGDQIVIGSRRLSIVDPAEATLAPPPPTTQAGRSMPQIAGFKMDRLLGQGGMGRVFLAEQESLHRPVALKILDSVLSSDTDFVRRFQSEARAAAALTHANVVVVHDVGESGGHHYLAMEYMAGGSLESTPGGSPALSWRRVLDVLHDAARGLVFAEEKGIVHRDIKPANLMLSGAGTVKIADLGLATTITAERGRDGGRVFGTPHFISPEQARGEPVDHRSDLYSLGATAFQLLAGRTPFEGASTREILRGVLTESPPDLATLVPDAPPALCGLIGRLIAKNPDDRPQSAASLLREVDRMRLEADHGKVLPEHPPGVASSPRLMNLGLAAAGIVVLVLAYKFVANTPDSDDGDPNQTPIAGGGGPTGDRGAGAPALEPGQGDPFAPITSPPSGEDEESAGRVMELEAQLAYQKIGPGIPLEERLGLLVALAKDYPGTTQSADLKIEIDALRLELARIQTESERLGSLLTRTQRDMRKLAGLPLADGSLPRPGDAMRQLLAYQTPGELQASPDFTSMHQALLAEVVQVSSTAFRAALDRGEAARAAGDFVALKSLLDELLPLFDLPPLPPEMEVQGYDTLGLIGTEVRAKHARFAGDQSQWKERLLQADRERLAARMGPGGLLAGHLHQLAIPAALAVARETHDGLQDPEVKDQVAALLEDLQHCADALAMLGQEWNSKGWRRFLVLDPRNKRGANRIAVAVTPEGVVLERDGRGELVTWSAWGGNTEALHQLFNERLSRPYTPQERLSIAALLRVSAVSRAAQVAGQTLARPDRPAFSSRQGDAVASAFAKASQWLEESHTEVERARLQDEQVAAAVLCQALLDASSGALSSSVAGLERLFQAHSNCLLVTLLADGTPWKDPPPSGTPGAGE